MKYKVEKEDGFTIIELLIYTGLIVVTVTVFTAFIIDVIRASTRVLSVKEVNQNSRLITSSISQAIKTAKSATTSATSIDLTDKDDINVQFYLDNSKKAVFYSNGVENIRISNEAVKVNKLNFKQDGNIISVGLGLETNRPSSYPGGNYSLQGTTTVVSRQKLY